MVGLGVPLFIVTMASQNVAGMAVCDGGLMIDLSLMRGVRVDPVSRSVRAEPGLLWKDLDHETLAFGLATTGGTVSSTGIGGLTLGGGLCWLMKKHGMTCDNLRSVDIVTADGRLLTASASENENLFWAVRGGGGNFGVVVSFEYDLHPMPPTIVGGMILYPMEQAREVLRFYRDYSAQAVDDLAVNAGILTTPDGVTVVGIFAAWFGAPEQAALQLQPLRVFGVPLADLTGPMPYAALQTMFDAAVPAGLRRYWKSGYLQNFSDEVIDTLLSHAATKTSPNTLVLIFRLGGKAARTAPDATAFGARSPLWDFDIVPQWQDAMEDGTHIEWARAFWRSIEPFTSGVYVNHLDGDDGAPRVRAAFGRNYERLARVKQEYDPTNLFRMNNNIVPHDEVGRGGHARTS